MEFHPEKGVVQDSNRIATATKQLAATAPKRAFIAANYTQQDGNIIAVEAVMAKVSILSERANIPESC